MLKQLVAMTFLLLTLSARPQSLTNTLSADLPLIPEDTKLFTESMLWHEDATLRTGAGWRDNVLLSPTNHQASAFLAGGLDYSLSRLPLDGLGFDLFITGDSMRYLQNVPTDGEEFWIVSATVKKYLGDNWLLGFEAQEDYVDQFEYAVFGNGVQDIELEGNLLRARPFIRRDLGTNAWLQLDLNGSREILDAPIGSDWRYGPKLTLGLGREKSSELDLSYEFSVMDSDSLQALAAGGMTDVPGHLVVLENNAALRWEQYWDDAKHWSIETKLGATLDKDNGGGYFNYHTYYGAERFRFQTRTWQVTATARLARQDFPVQRTDVTTGPLLDIWTVQASLHAERRLTSWLKLYAEYSYGRAISNQSDDQYQSNVVMGGAIWEF